jgi:hypothetical protein
MRTFKGACLRVAERGNDDKKSERCVGGGMTGRRTSTKLEVDCDVEGTEKLKGLIGARVLGGNVVVVVVVGLGVVVVEDEDDEDEIGRF